jgi:hypothetical protein
LLGFDAEDLYCIDQPKHLPVVSEKGPICYRTKTRPNQSL